MRNELMNANYPGQHRCRNINDQGGPIRDKGSKDADAGIFSPSSALS
jgi:hypothetical protein